VTIQSHCMTQVATITVQRQLSLPVALFHNKVFSAGQKVIIETLDDGIKITPAVSLVRKLAGSVSIPARFRGMGIPELKEKAIKEYFATEPE